MRALRDHRQRIAVGRGLLDLLHGDAAAGARLEFDDNLLADIFRHRLRHHRGDQIGCGALAERHDDGDGPIRIWPGLHRRHAGEARE